MKYFLSFILMIVISNSCISQISGYVQIKAGVLDPVSVINTRNLNFGENIFPGLKMSVDKSSENAASFIIGGEAGKQISLTLTLPSYLNNGSSELPLIFNPDDGEIVSGDTRITFNPNATAYSIFPSSGILSINIGASVNPRDSQEPGIYSGNITIHIQYTGN